MGRLAIEFPEGISAGEPRRIMHTLADDVRELYNLAYVARRRAHEGHRATYGTVEESVGDRADR
jgi:hypothetical protein